MQIGQRVTVLNPYERERGSEPLEGTIEWISEYDWYMIRFDAGWAGCYFEDRIIELDEPLVELGDEETELDFHRWMREWAK